MDKIKERQAKYHCTGHCYGCNTNLPRGHKSRIEMCPGIDVCPETRRKEFYATLFAILTLILSPIILLILYFTILGGT